MLRLLFAVLMVCPLFSGDWYLFTSFRRNGETGVFFALSDDGRKWTPLNGNQPSVKPETVKPETSNPEPLKPQQPGMLMRDPWLGQGPDGVWHMLWTWGGAPRIPAADSSSATPVPKT